MTEIDRFLDKVDRDAGFCWEWLGVVTNGYGRFHSEGRMKGAHRFAYEWWVGPIPEGHDIHHGCGNKTCCNPEHLQAVPHGVHGQHSVNERWKPVITLRRHSDHTFEDFIEFEGTRSGRRTVSVDPDRLNDYLEQASFKAWSEDQDNEDAWYLRPIEP